MNIVQEAVYENGVLKPDQPLPLKDKQRVRIRVQSLEKDQDARQLRRVLARKLVQRAGELLPYVGDVALPTYLQLLEDDLAHGHEILEPHGSEVDYLSLITLIESALVCQTWKQFTRRQVKALQAVLRLGCSAKPIGLEGFDKARGLLADAGVETTPRIDLDALTESDLEDD